MDALETALREKKFRVNKMRANLGYPTARYGPKGKPFLTQGVLSKA